MSLVLSFSRLLVFDRSDLRMLRNFLHMMVRDRFLGSGLGLIWAVANPILMLGIFTFVFGFVFKSKLTGTPVANIRFFDDNQMLHGSYFPGIDVAVEPRARLLEKPTDRLVIFSHTFGEKLRGELAPALPGTRIVTWADLFGSAEAVSGR